MSEALRARKFRRIVVYSVSGAVFGLSTIGLLYGLRPMLLPLVLGAFLAYLFKPLAKSFRGSTISNYIRACALLYVVGLGLYWSFNFVKNSLPDEMGKLQLKVRLQYRMNERYLSWMGLNENPKGNFIYKSIGRDLEQFKVKAINYVKLTDDEQKDFKRLNDTEQYQDENSKRYLQYYLQNIKAPKEDIENSKTKNKANLVVAKVDTPAPESNALAQMMTVFSHWIIMPLAFIFILLDKGQILHFFIKLIPNRYFELTYSILENVDEALGKYIRGTMIECFLVGVSLVVGFYLCGFEIEIAVLIGIIGGLTNAIPFVGTALACAFGAVYSLIAENVEPVLPFVNENNLVLAVIGVVMVAHLLDNALFQPLVVGSAVNIHPLVVILGVFGGSMMFGFAGLIFAIPSIVIIKVVTETFFTGLKNYRII